MKADGTIWIDTKIDDSGMDEGFNRIRGGVDSVTVSFRKAGQIIEKSFSNLNFNKTIENLKAQIRSLEDEFEAVSREYADALKFDDDKSAERLGAKRTKIYDRIARAREKLAIEVAAAAEKEAAAEEKASQRAAAAAKKEATAKRQDVTSQFDSAGNAASYFGNRLRGIVSSAFIFNVISSGLRKITSYFGTALMANNQFSNAVTRLKTSLMAAFQPIYEAVLPALTTLVNWLNMAVQAVGRFFAALAGKSYKTMQKNAQSLGGAIESAGSASGSLKDTAGAIGSMGDALDDTGKKAKKAERYLAGFDEINRMIEPAEKISSNIPDIPENAPGNIGLGEFTTEDMGFDDKISPKIETIVDKIKELLEPLRKIDFTPLKNALANLGASFSALGSTIGSALEWAWFNILVPLASWTIQEAVPAIINVLAAAFEVFNSVLIALKPLAEWLWENFLKPLAEWTGGVIIDVLNWLAEALKKVSDWILENQTLVQNLAIIVGAFAVAWQLVNAAITIWNAISGVATALTTAFGAAVAFLTSPVALVAVAIGALIAVIALLALNWDTVKEKALACWEGIKKAWSAVSQWFQTHIIQPIKDFFTDLFDKISEMVQKLRDSITEHFEKAASAVEDRFINPVRDWWNRLKESIVGAIVNACKSIENKFYEAAEYIKNKFIQPMKTSVEETAKWITEKFNGAKEKVKEMWKSMADWFKQTVTEPIRNFFNKLCDGIIEGFKKVADNVNTAIKNLVATFNSLIDSMSRAINTMLNAFSSARSRTSGSTAPAAAAPVAYAMMSYPTAEIPMLARGAVIPPNHKFLAVLGDQRHGTNVEAPLETIQEAVALAMSDIVPAMVASIEAVIQRQDRILEAVESIELDGETISNAVSSYNRKMSVVKGGSF